MSAFQISMLVMTLASIIFVTCMLIWLLDNIRQVKRLSNFHLDKDSYDFVLNLIRCSNKENSVMTCENSRINFRYNNKHDIEYIDLVYKAKFSLFKDYYLSSRCYPIFIETNSGRKWYVHKSNKEFIKQVKSAIRRRCRTKLRLG